MRHSSQLCFLIAVSLFFSALSVQAQPQSPAKKKKANAESCDGAADIVPAKPLSFVRKRRPTPKEQQAESKSEKDLQNQE